MKASQNKKPLISVIVPVFNVEEYLHECLDSIINQSYNNLEIIVVNDGSTDNSLSICSEYKERDDRIIVINKDNGGLSSARNTGLNVAKGEYISFIDSDDYIDKEMIMLLYTACVDNNCEIAYCGRYDIYGEITQKGLCPTANKKMDKFTLMNKIFVWDNVDNAVCDKLFKACLWKGCRFPEGLICEDIATTYKIVLNANNIYSINKPLYNYRHRPNSITTSSFSAHSFDYEHHTKTILNYLYEHNYTMLYENAKKFRMSSLLYTISFITTTKHNDYKIYKKVFYSYKKEIADYYKNKKPPRIVKKYLHKTLRGKYYFIKMKSIIYVISIKTGLIKIYRGFKNAKKIYH